VILELLNEAGQIVLVYEIFRCWVSEYVALPDLDANAGVIAIQRMTLQNQGWRRDPSVLEPAEPSFSDPA
jgi:phage tail-like protein